MIRAKKEQQHHGYLGKRLRKEIRRVDATGMGTVAVPLNSYDRDGRRKYLTARGARSVIRGRRGSAVQVRTFRAMLAYTMCRISEALALTAARVDLTGRYIVLESLTKRTRGVYRPAPMPFDMVKRWLGHANLETSELYVNAVSAEEDQPARRMW